ncbi:MULTISPECIES: ABC transporter permease [Gammaproteobacteria]|uniref:ABC transporter permease n=1 Tax=Gammaproteobacteria TaxID=1236 RepID=UPI000DD083B0|nr:MULTISPECIES: ABC transporter permease subunit [Gammaproteobacteria]RTE86251.1 ABC transporter permease [Aliidiomarina sp. B3213]TCZ91602.1 ABC transporter permease [Lysobacter sp. N42]
MTSAWKTVWLKELKDAIRDRRSVMAAMSYAFFGPMLMAVAFFAVVNQATSKSDLEVSLTGAEYAPELVRHLQQNGIVAHEDPEQASIELTIPEDYQEKLASAEPITIIIRADYSERKGSDARRRVESAINGYNRIVAGARLMMRGVSPEVMQAITPARQDTATKESRAALIMGTVMVFVIMSVFFAGMNVAIDTSAGERERNSLEFLLAQPLTSADLVLGKAFTASTFAMLGGVLTLAMIPLVFMFVPLEKLGIDVSFSFLTQATLALVLLPVALFASFLQLLVSFLAKSFKEAQTYITFVMFAPMTVVFVLEFTRFSHPALAYLPITSQHQALLGSINGEPVSALPLLIGGVSTLIVAAILAFVVQWKLKSEKVVFGL